MPSQILLVDDDETYRYAVAKTLENAGHDVSSAPDYREALELLAVKPFDLLITDIVMPKQINGFALARMARMRNLDLRVLYMTAYDIPTDEAFGKVLRKPVADADLLAEVKAALA